MSRYIIIMQDSSVHTVLYVQIIQYNMHMFFSVCYVCHMIFQYL